MFDALSGLKEAIAEKERIIVPKKCLGEDMIEELNNQLVQLSKGQMITVVYYCVYEQNYLQYTGPVVKVDAYWSILQVGNIRIDFCEIAELIMAG